MKAGPKVDLTVELWALWRADETVERLEILRAGPSDGLSVVEKAETLALQKAGHSADQTVASRAEPKAVRWAGTTAGRSVATMVDQMGAQLVVCWVELRAGP